MKGFCQYIRNGYTYGKNGYLVSTENIVCRQKVEPFLWLVPKDPTLSPESVESSFRLVGRTEHIFA